MTRGRLRFLDAVRGVAALAVAAGHALESTSPRFAAWSASWFSPGRAGVCAFFLVSGFVIPISLERAAEGTVGRGDALRRFAVGRAGRLYPMYWASLAGVLVLAWAGVDALPADFRADLPGAAVVNATMVQELVGVPHAIGVYYTLTIELIWYLACAALFAAGVLHATERLAWIALGGLAVIGLGAPVLLDRHTPFSTGFYLLTMLVGTALARREAGVLPTRRLLALLAATAAVAALGCWANYVHVPGAADPDGDLGFSAAFLPWVAAYAAVFVAYAVRDRAVLFPGLLVWLGVISYSLYLLHPAVLAVVFDWSDEPLVTLAMVVVFSVAVSALTQRWIERPGQQLARRHRTTRMRV